jgi:hypothetical protein
MNKRNSQQLFAPSTLGPEACYLDKRLFDKRTNKRLLFVNIVILLF